MVHGSLGVLFVWDELRVTFFGLKRELLRLYLNFAGGEKLWVQASNATLASLSSPDANHLCGEEVWSLSAAAFDALAVAVFKAFLELGPEDQNLDEVKYVMCYMEVRYLMNHPPRDLYKRSETKEPGILPLKNWGINPENGFRYFGATLAEGGMGFNHMETTSGTAKAPCFKGELALVVGPQWMRPRKFYADLEPHLLELAEAIVKGERGAVNAKICSHYSVCQVDKTVEIYIAVPF